MALAAGGDPGPGQAVVERDRLAVSAPAQGEAVELDLAHRLGAAGDDDVRGAGLNLHRRGDDGGQARPAAAIDLVARHLDRQAGVERGDPADRRGLPVRVALAEDHVVDLGWIDAAALDDRADDGRSEPGGRNVAEDAAEAPDRRPQGLADHRLSHPESLASVASRRRSSGATR